MGWVLALLGHVSVLVSPKPWGEPGAELGRSLLRASGLCARRCAAPEQNWGRRGGAHPVPYVILQPHFCRLLPVTAADAPSCCCMQHCSRALSPAAAVGAEPQRGLGGFAEVIFRRITELTRPTAALQCCRRGPAGTQLSLAWGNVAGSWGWDSPNPAPQNPDGKKIAFGV